MYKSGSNTTANCFKNPINFDFGAGTGGGGLSSVIDEDGKVWVTGYNNYGQSGNGTTTQTLTTFGLVKTSTAANYLPSNYKAVATSTSDSNYSTMLLTDNGYLYGAGYSNYLGLATTATTNSTFRRLDGIATNLPAHSDSNPIKDFVSATGGSYVLYENGDLYYTSSNSSYSGKYTKIASDITMFDEDGNGSAVTTAYMYNEKTNMIQYHKNNTAKAVDLIEPVGTPIQVRSSVGGWGYLNDNNELRLSSSSTTTMPGASNATSLGKNFYTINDVSYFDIGGQETTILKYGIMTTSGQMKFWGDAGYGALGNGSTTDKTYTAATTPTTGGTYPTTMLPDLGNGLSRSNPPAVKMASLSNFY